MQGKSVIGPLFIIRKFGKKFGLHGITVYAIINEEKKEKNGNFT